MLRIAMVLATLSVFTNVTSAAILHDELVDGDLQWSGGVYNTHVYLEEGSNLILGSQFNSHAGGDADHFKFTVAEGMQLDEILFNYWDIVTQTWAIAHVTWGIKLDDGTLNGKFLGVAGQTPILSPPETVNLFVDDFPGASGLGILPLGEGLYSMNNSLGASFGVGNADSWGVWWDYSLEFVVSSNEVPIPAAAWLFGSALIGLIGLKRKKQ